MYLNVSEEFMQKITSYSRTFRAKLIFDNFEITDDIFSVQVQGGMNLDTALTLGTTTSVTAEIDILANGRNYKNKRFQLMIGLKLDNGEYEYIPYGYYVVLEAVRKEQKITLSCADLMSVTDKIFNSSLNYPNTGENVINEISEKYNFTHNITGLEDVVIPFRPPVKTTARELIGAIASLAGYNAIFDREGVLNFKWYSDEGARTTTDYIDNPFINEEDFSVNYLMYEISSKVSDVYGDSESTSGISIKNEYALSGRQSGVWERIRNFAYRPVDLKQRLGNILIDAWDIVTIEANGEEIRTIPMSIDMNYDGGVSVSITATAPDTDKEYKSPSEIQAEKQAEKDENNSLVLTASNDNLEELSTNENEILRLEFNVQNESLPFVNATLQLEDVTAGVITTNLKINGSIYQTYRISANDGYNLMSFATAFMNLSGGTNELSLHIVGDKDDMGVIQPKQANVILTGYGLVSRVSWAGAVVLDDVIVSVFNLIKEISVQSVSENIDFSVIEPESIVVSESINVVAENFINSIEKTQAVLPYEITKVSNVSNDMIVIEYDNMLMMRNTGVLDKSKFSFIGFQGATPTPIEVYEVGLEKPFAENLVNETAWTITDTKAISNYVEIDISNDYIVSFVNNSLDFVENDLEKYTEEQLEFFYEVELESKDYKATLNYYDADKQLLSSVEFAGTMQLEIPSGTAFVNVEVESEKMTSADLLVFYVKIEQGTESTVFRYSNKIVLKVSDLRDYNETISYSIADLGLINPVENGIIETEADGSFTRLIYEEG